MTKKILAFIKYNNFFLLILAVFFVAGGSVFATEAGREALGAQEKAIVGTDNTLLLAADLERFDPGYRIEKIEADEKYYYATYTYLDLVLKNGAWQYQTFEGRRKVSRARLKGDLGIYLADELGEEASARQRDLMREQEQAQGAGQAVRMEVSEYSGLIGAALDAAAKVFPGYEAVVRSPIPSPVAPSSLAFGANASGTPDSLSQLALEAEAKVGLIDPDFDGWVSNEDNCPDNYNPDQTDADSDGYGNSCDPDWLVGTGVASGTPETLPEESSATTEDITPTEIAEPIVEEAVPDVVEVVEIQ